MTQEEFEKRVEVLTSECLVLYGDGQDMREMLWYMADGVAMFMIEKLKEDLP